VLKIYRSLSESIMGFSTRHIYILSLFLIDQLRAQTGAGCFQSGCDQPGQVRVDAIFDSYGNFLGGCNCGCPHRSDCLPPNKINFNPLTLEGDCECQCPNGKVGGLCDGNPGTAVRVDCSCDISMVECPGNQVADAMSGACSCLNECTMPMVLNEMTCECEHVSTLPGGVAPPSTNPSGPSPVMMTTAEPAVMFAEVIECRGASCECTGNGPCTILCDQWDSQCKDATLKCANNYDCSIICGENGCNKAMITGPDGHDFWMYCDAPGACGDATIGSELARHVTTSCGGKDSCKGAGTHVNCGYGICELSFTGVASGDSAFIHENFALGFNCIGRYVDCPNNYDPPCAGLGACPCSGLQCFAERDHFDQCKCYCPEDLVMLQQSGEPDAAICGWQNTGHVFDANECSCDCPAGSYPTGGCPAAQRWNTRTCQCECPNNPTGECAGWYVFDEETCSCRCPAHAPSPFICKAMGRKWKDCACQCEEQCPGPGQIQSFSDCSCKCPLGSPTESQCDKGVNPLTCKCRSNHCCVTSVPGYKPWQGMCWDEVTEAGCLAEPNLRCKWDEMECLADPPMNSISSSPCKYANAACIRDSDCCSENCKVSGFCQ